MTILEARYMKFVHGTWRGGQGPGTAAKPTRDKNPSLQHPYSSRASQETLKISLKEEKAVGLRQQELVQKLQEEIKTLNQWLQNKSSELEGKSADLEKKSTDLQEVYTELEKLRKENEALVSAKGPPDSGICLILYGAAVLLSLLALLVCCLRTCACR
ncbi:hypothetical protein MDA_GLEAN10002989 [Myotis davidii]|uniref:Uncharacterized protein n=1 Tax=Myotis davidii TaxID=225400 RepID=L5LC25_MYODS|nr:hypothetical protein MDA_GLEAN10002989 [Myotis davidii]